MIYKFAYLMDFSITILAIYGIVTIYTFYRYFLRETTTSCTNIFNYIQRPI